LKLGEKGLPTTLTLLRPAAPALAAGPVVSVDTLSVLVVVVLLPFSSLRDCFPEVPDEPESVRGLYAVCFKNMVDVGVLMFFDETLLKNLLVKGPRERCPRSSTRCSKGESMRR